MKLFLCMPWRHIGEAQLKIHSFLALDLVEWSILHTGCFPSGERTLHTHWPGGWVDPKGLVDICFREERMKTSWPCKDSKHHIDELSYPCSEVGFICIIMFQLIMGVKHCCLKIIFWDVALCILYLCTKLYSATPQKTAMFIASVLIGQVWFSYCIILMPEKKSHSLYKTRIDSKMCICSTQNFSGLNWCDESWTWPKS